MKPIPNEINNDPIKADPVDIDWRDKNIVAKVKD